MVSRPAEMSCNVEICRANCGATTSPVRTASNNLIRSVTTLAAAANVVASMPSSKPEGSNMLSKPFSSARNTMSLQCSHELASFGSVTPRN